MSEPTVPDGTDQPGAEVPPPGDPSGLSAEASAEFDTYSGALKASQVLQMEGRVSEALETLNRLPAPSTEAGAAYLVVVDLMKRLYRALLYTFAGDKQAALTEWRAVSEGAPPIPGFDEVRRLADSWVVVQERDIGELTEEERQSLHPQVQMFVNQQLSLRSVTPSMKAAWEALGRGDEGEYASQMAKIQQDIELAGAENPAVKSTIEGFYGVTHLLVLAMGQQKDFDRFDFGRVFDAVAPIEAKSKQVASSEAATTPQAMPMAWIPAVAGSVTVLALVTDRLARLMRTLLSHETTAKQLDEISQIQDQIRTQQRTLRDLTGLTVMEPVRTLLLDIYGTRLSFTERLSLEVHPTRRTVLNVAGVAAAISFVTVAALLLFVGRATDTDLNAGIVLALSAFFGLVAGFGYGALRFRGFLTSVLFGHGQEGA
jgi:hypothetical protein